MGVDIVSLSCPVCGAPFTANDEKCSYCGSILVLRTDHPKINPASLNKQVIDERISEFRNDLRRDPYDSTAHYGLGVAYFNLRLTDDSVHELEAAARLMPENPNIQSQLAVVLKQAVDEGRPGAKAKLRDRIEYTLRLDPDNLDALLLKIESDKSLGDRRKLELLEQMYEVDPDRIKPRLCAALIERARSEGIRDTPEEIELLGRAHNLDPDRLSEELANALYRRAANLSDSDPYADVVDPTRSNQAVKAWYELHEFNPKYAEGQLKKFLGTAPDLTKADDRRLRKLATNTLNTSSKSVQRQEIFDKVATTTNTATTGIVKPIIKGVLKAIGLLITLLIVFAITISLLPEDHIISNLLAFVIVLSLLALPIIMPIREVKRVQRKNRQHHEISTPRPAPQPLQASVPQSNDFVELLSILRSYFLHRWERQREFRIQMDRTNGGAKAEKQRDNQFRSSLTSSN